MKLVGRFIRWATTRSSAWTIGAYALGVFIVGASTDTLLGYLATGLYFVVITAIAHFKGYDEGVDEGLEAATRSWVAREELMSQTRSDARIANAKWN